MIELIPTKAERLSAATEASKRKVAPELMQILNGYNASFAPSPQRDANLAALAQGNTAAIFTGQQIGLYLSPCLIIYKALAAIKTAAALAEETGIRCVPVFWLQTEDHDFAEIHSTAILGPGGELIPLALDEPPAVSAQSVQYYTLGSSVSNLQAVLDEQFSRFPEANTVLEVMRTNYRPGMRLADAFAQSLAALTSEFGLILFNPQLPGAAQFKRSVFRHALARYQSIDSLLIRQTEALEAGGEKAQVNLRTDSPLFFFHEHSPEGPRQRLVWDAGHSRWKIGKTNTLISTEELELLLEQSPERFTTSALLRPILQSSLFPAAAYVAGPAEQRYFKQLQPLFKEFNLPDVLVFPRPLINVIEPKSAKLLSELQLNPADLNQPDDALLRNALSNSQQRWAAPAALEQSVTEQIRKGLEILRANVAELDQSLLRPATKCEDKVQNALNDIFQLYLRSAAEKESVTVARLQRLKWLLLPDGQMQERVLSPLYFAARYGASWLSLVYEEIVPFMNQDLQLKLN